MINMAELIEKFCEIHSDECRFHEGYSGRGMFGKRCVGFECDRNSHGILVKLCDFLYSNGVESAEDALGNICRDSLGMDTIIYFPHISA